MRRPVTMFVPTVFFVVILVAQAFAQEACYRMGTSAPIQMPIKYVKCPGSNMCCRTNDDSADTCVTEGSLKGLCRSHDLDLWRESCTDQRWKSDECVKLCLDPYVDPNNKTWNRAESDYLVTQCDDGSLCCGSRGSPEFGECCRENRGVWLDNLKVVSTKPNNGSTSSTSSTGQPTPSTTIPTKPAAASTSRTAIVAGAVAGVLGGIAAITGLVLLVWLLRRHKKRKAGNDAEMENTPAAQDEKCHLRAELWEQDRKPPGELSGAVELVELGVSPSR